MITVPLHLWNRPHWELTGRVDVAHFFRVLKTTFPTATALFVEGTMIAGDVQEFFRSAGEPGPYLPASQTIWPRPKQFRLRADDPTLTRLMELADSHAAPEILEHIFLYTGDDPLMEYPDAFARKCPMFISADVSEGQIRWFAEELHLKAAKVGMV